MVRAISSGAGARVASRLGEEAEREVDKYVPLFQTLSWVVLIVGGTLVFRSRLDDVLAGIRERIRTGSSLEAGPIKLGEDLRRLERVGGASPEPAKDPPKPPERAALPAARSFSGVVAIESDGGEQSGSPDRAAERQAIYDQNRNLFLAHVLEPSTTTGQKYDVFIFLVRHGSDDFGDVDGAEFFLGRYWQNRVFTEKVKEGKIGLVTAAYGPFLCTCRVRFKDGTHVTLHRYIDFEMGRLFRSAA
jgi:hypothetical protein